MEQKLMEIWNEKITDIDFLHHFINEEIKIYKTILENRLHVIEGSINKLCKDTFGIDDEVFFGFLLGLNELLQLNLESLTSSSKIKIILDFKDLYSFISEKSYYQLADIRQWTNYPDESLMLKVGILLRNTNFIPASYNTMFNIAKDYGVELFAFSQKDVDYNNKKIMGKFLEDSKFVFRSTSYPHVIDNFTLNEEHLRLALELSQYSKFTKQAPPASINTGKYGGIELIEKLGFYGDIIIPTVKIEKFEDIELNLIKFNNEIVLKPNIGNTGEGVLKLSKKGNIFFIVNKGKIHELKKEELKAYYDEKLNNVVYVIQPYIESKTKYGEPYSIFMYAKRGGDGNFVTSMYPSIGDPKQVASNVIPSNTMPIEEFLEREFGDLSEDIINKLNDICINFPERFQTFFPDKLFGISLNIGIKKIQSGFSLHVYGVNDAIRGNPHLLLLDAQTSLEYYWYLYNN